MSLTQIANAIANENENATATANATQPSSPSRELWLELGWPGPWGPGQLHSKTFIIPR